MKRTFDLLLGIPIFLAALPIIAVCALIVFLADGGSPFFVSRRQGRAGRIFRMYKLRSMRLETPIPLPHSTLNHNRYLTPCGFFLRHLKIDELCQFFHVLTGQMSLVGPRPHLDVESVWEPETQPVLDYLKPGVTDLSSLIFFDLGEVLANSSDPQMAYSIKVKKWKNILVKLYAANQSIGLDLQIIAITLVSVVQRGLGMNLSLRLVRKLGCNTREIEELLLGPDRDGFQPSYPEGYSGKAIPVSLGNK